MAVHINTEYSVLRSILPVRAQPPYGNYCAVCAFASSTRHPVSRTSSFSPNASSSPGSPFYFSSTAPTGDFSGCPAAPLLALSVPSISRRPLLTGHWPTRGPQFYIAPGDRRYHWFALGHAGALGGTWGGLAPSSSLPVPNRYHPPAPGAICKHLQAPCNQRQPGPTSTSECHQSTTNTLGTSPSICLSQRPDCFLPQLRVVYPFLFSSPHTASHLQFNRRSTRSCLLIPSTTALRSHLQCLV